MDKGEILAFLRRNPIFHLATVEDNKPHVRKMALFRADENGIIFHAPKAKDVVDQMAANPQVELCFDNWEGDVEVRVAGSVELTEDAATKKEIDPDGHEDLAVYRLKNGQASVWTLATNTAPKSYVEI